MAEKLKNVLAQLKIEAISKNPDAPQDVKLQPKDLADKVQKSDGSYMEVNYISKVLKQLKNKNKVIHYEDEHMWQHGDYEDVLPNFDKSD